MKSNTTELYASPLVRKSQGWCLLFMR